MCGLLNFAIVYDLIDLQSHFSYTLYFSENKFNLLLLSLINLSQGHPTNTNIADDLD